MRYLRLLLSVSLYYQVRLWIGALVLALASLAQADIYLNDELGRLRKVTYPDGSSIAYEYDVRGNITRVVKTPPLEPDIDLNTTSVDFGSVTVGESNTDTITVRNIGTGLLQILGVDGSGELEPPFSLSVDNCSEQVLASTQSCELELRFAPVAGGDFQGSFAVESNDPDEVSVAVDVSGVGVTAEIDAGDAIAGLISRVGDLGLPQGLDNALTVKLQGALAAYESDGPAAIRSAANKLQAFINQVEAKRNKNLSDELADALISDAQEIIELLYI